MIIREFSEKNVDEIITLMNDLCKIQGQDFDEIRLRDRLMEQKNTESNKEVMVALEKKSKKVLGMSYCSIRNSDNGERFGHISNLIVLRTIDSLHPK